MGALTAPAFRIRAGREDDHAFISESWMQAWGQTAIGREMGPTYISDQKALIRRILDRPRTEVRIAVGLDVADDDVIFGFAVLGDLRTLVPLIYFVFVKRDVRRQGVCTQLLSDLRERQCVMTHKPHQRAVDAWDVNGKKLVTASPMDPNGIGDIIPKPKLWSFNYYRNWET